MRERKSLVVVVDEDGQAEVHAFDVDQVRGPSAIEQRLGELRPGPGELGSRAWARQSRDAVSKGFVDVIDPRRLARATAMSGSRYSEVHDEDYSAREGCVLVVDADVDYAGGGLARVDWDTAVPHAATDPYSVDWPEPAVRSDLSIVDPEALASGRHVVAVDRDGVPVPFNEHGFEVVEEPAQTWAAYDASVASGQRDSILPNRGTMAVTVYDTVPGDRPRVRAETLETLLERGTVPEREHCGGAVRSVDVESLVRAAGQDVSVLYDDSGARVGTVYVVEASFGDEVPGAGRVTDVLSSTPAQGFEGLAVGGPGGPVRSLGARGEVGAQSLFLGASESPRAPALQPQIRVPERRGAEPTSVSASRLAARRAAGLAGRAASTTVEGVRRHGPTAMAKVSEQLAKNPELTQMAKTAAVQAASSMVVAKTGANPQAVKKVADKLMGPSL